MVRRCGRQGSIVQLIASSLHVRLEKQVLLVGSPLLLCLQIQMEFRLNHINGKNTYLTFEL